MKIMNNRMYPHNRAKRNEIEREKTKTITDKIKRISKIMMSKRTKALKKPLKRSNNKSQLKKKVKKPKKNNSPHLNSSSPNPNRQKTSPSNKPNNPPNKKSNPHLRKNPNLHKANLPTMTIF